MIADLALEQPNVKSKGAVESSKKADLEKVEVKARENKFLNSMRTLREGIVEKLDDVKEKIVEPLATAGKNIGGSVLDMASDAFLGPLGRFGKQIMGVDDSMAAVGKLFSPIVKGSKFLNEKFVKPFITGRLLKTRFGMAMARWFQTFGSRLKVFSKKEELEAAEDQVDAVEDSSKKIKIVEEGISDLGDKTKVAYDVEEKHERISIDRLEEIRDGVHAQKDTTEELLLRFKDFTSDDKILQSRRDSALKEYRQKTLDAMKKQSVKAREVSQKQPGGTSVGGGLGIGESLLGSSIIKKFVTKAGLLALAKGIIGGIVLAAPFAALGAAVTILSKKISKQEDIQIKQLKGDEVKQLNEKTVELRWKETKREIGLTHEMERDLIDRLYEERNKSLAKEAAETGDMFKRQYLKKLADSNIERGQLLGLMERKIKSGDLGEDIKKKYYESRKKVNKKVTAVRSKTRELQEEGKIGRTEIDRTIKTESNKYDEGKFVPAKPKSAQVSAYRKEAITSKPAIAASKKASELGLVKTSGYRDPMKNWKEGGSPTSYHLVGQAADYSGSVQSMDAFAQWAKKSGMFKEVVWRARGHNDHVHVAWDKPLSRVPEALVMDMRKGSKPYVKGKEQEIKEPGEVAVNVKPYIKKQPAIRDATNVAAEQKQIVTEQSLKMREMPTSKEAVKEYPTTSQISGERDREFLLQQKALHKQLILNLRGGDKEHTGQFASVPTPDLMNIPVIVQDFGLVLGNSGVL